jgi:hypothetical protein
MKKINYKKEYLREFNLRCDYSEKMDKYRKKWLFWQPLGIVGAIFLLSLVVFALVSTLNNPQDYRIYRTDCHNETKAIPCGLINYHNQTIYACPSYYVEVNTSVISGISNVLPQEEILMITLKDVNKKRERKTCRINIKVTPSTRKWMDKENISPQKLFDEAIIVIKKQTGELS